MTGNTAVDLAISLGGVVVLALVSWMLGGWRTVRVDAANAAERLALDEPDFAAAGWMIGADGAAAAATSATGRETVLVFRIGDGLASRRFRHGAVGIERRGLTLVFRVNEPSRREVHLTASSDAQAEQWLLQLAGQRL